jgi:uncharacterized SAM-binding protein YcdF (DUF218 family)
MSLLRNLLRIAFAGLAALGLLMVLVTFTPLVPWYARLLAGPWNDSLGDVLIVLGGATIDNDNLAPGSYWRSVYTERVWRTGHFREVLLCGAGVAPLMRDFLVCHSVPAAVIRIEDSSHSTHESALDAKRLLAGVPGRKVLLTSDYHTFRARCAFAKAGLDVLTHPFPDVIKTSGHLTRRWEAFLLVVNETGKIVYYWLRGWI